MTATLITCPDCGLSTVSPRATACPKCNFKLATCTICRELIGPRETILGNQSPWSTHQQCHKRVSDPPAETLRCADCKSEMPKDWGNEYFFEPLLNRFSPPPCPVCGNPDVSHWHKKVHNCRRCPFPIFGFQGAVRVGTTDSASDWMHTFCKNPGEKVQQLELSWADFEAQRRATSAQPIPSSTSSISPSNDSFPRSWVRMVIVLVVLAALWELIKWKF
jgi:hypothetical protein